MESDDDYGARSKLSRGECSAINGSSERFAAASSLAASQQSERGSTVYLYNLRVFKPSVTVRKVSNLRPFFGSGGSLRFSHTRGSLQVGGSLPGDVVLDKFNAPGHGSGNDATRSLHRSKNVVECVGPFVNTKPSSR